MAKIIHVGGFSLKPKGAFQHSVAIKLSNGLVRNDHSVVNFSDRDVARAESFLGHRKFGIGAANKALRALCRETAPDLLLLGHADVIRPETIQSIRHDFPALRVVQWNVDPIFEDDNIRRISTKLEVVDATLVSTAGDALLRLDRPGKKLGFLPNPVDFSIESGRNHERDDLGWDVFFACGGAHLPRQVCGTMWNVGELIALCEREVPKLRVRLAGLRGEPHLVGARYQKALESAAIGLNISRRSDFLLYSSDRLPQMCGNGMAVLIERATGYDRLFDESEFAFFSSIEELIEQLRRLVSDGTYRRKLGAAGRARYHALFNEKRIARYIVDVAFDSVRTTDYEWPTLVSPPAALGGEAPRTAGINASVTRS